MIRNLSLGSVVEIKVATDDVQAFLSQAGRRLFEIGGPQEEVAARSITVVDASGSPVMVHTWDNLQQHGTLWIDPLLTVGTGRRVSAGKRLRILRGV